MEKAPGGSPVGVDDPYGHAERCDHVTDEGKCRWAVENGYHDPEFADARSVDDFRCLAADPDGDWGWRDCPHFRSLTDGKECIRCGLEERRLAHDDVRPLLEEHHLSYAVESAQGEGRPSHEITVSLCRWCHAKVHNSWARIDDDASPDPDAIAEAETRKGQELDELAFESAAERFDPGE
ncbi:DUF7097 family protein [Halapricum hydrolyticum]|uniref:Uncharacterized protein n=1 Tax=Halapricum hydrolyticum TaxID=2979991 RepID=A0AAE3LK83_9EURY|nr:hypothetical protein [Halapricum hydrolyticum]MCU4719110.1 hypothetical protein [Halapricum hydrolyticum]MCU4728118.1 hypothetical protein [Halapricum hydrolyticum]